MGARRRRPRTSTDCPHTPDAIAAGNLVADTIDGQPIDGWAAVVDALGDLHRRRVQPFTTQLLLDELHVLRGGDGVVAGTHPCDGVAAARLTQGEVVAGRPDTRFWVWEYATATALAGEWNVGEDGRAAPQLACAAVDGDFVANRNLVVEVPASTAFDLGEFAIFALNGIERSLGLRPYTLGDLARAIDAGGLEWGFLSDSGGQCYSPALELQGVRGGVGRDVSVGDPTAPDASITITVFVYSVPERVTLEWEIGPDGQASSQQCGGFSEAWATGNVVVAFEPGFYDDSAGIWPRLVAVVQALAERDRRQAQPFTTQLLLDGLYALGGAAVVPGSHPCDRVAAARLTQGEVFAGRPDTRFWVWEYPSARDLGRQWTLGEDGRATSRLACAAADGDYVANRNLVVEIPASSAPEPTRYARPDGLERALEFQPYTLGRIARAIDESGLDWRFYGDVRFPCFGPPGERAPDDAGLGVNASIGQPGSTDEESISPIVYVYRSPEGLRHEWDVESDGRASSERCTTFGVGWAAGNVVIAFDASWVPDPLGVWPRVGTVMQGLAEEADSSLSRS